MFGVKTSSRSTLGVNPRISHLSASLEGSLCWYTQEKKSQKVKCLLRPKGEQTPCCPTACLRPYTARRLHKHPKTFFAQWGNLGPILQPSVTQGTDGLMLTTPPLLSISFEDCTRFIKPTQTGAPPPLPQTNTLRSRHNKHPGTKSSWRKAPWTQRRCAGRRAQKGLCDGRGTIRPETKGPVFTGRDSRDRLAGEPAAHTVSRCHLHLEAPL